MKKMLTLAVTALALGLAGCGDDDDNGPSAPTLDTPAAINAYLDGKTWTMTGNDIPTHPNGFLEDVNFGAATQCYNTVTLDTTNAAWTTTSILGTLLNAPATGDVGDCDRATPGATLSFTSTAVLIENVQGNGDCFDVTVTYTGFAQEGRGKFSDDGTTMTLELFFTGQATGHRCANGAVGSGGITLNGQPFAGDAQQTYRLQ